MRAVDLHSDLQLDIARAGDDPAHAYAERHLPGMTEGGIEVRIASTVALGPDATAAAFRHLASIRRAGCAVAIAREDLRLNGTPDQRGPLFVLGLEGAEPFGQDLGLVEAFVWDGVRVVQPAWMYQNAVTGSCGDAHPRGITTFGGRVLRRLAELGVVVDLAHISDPAFEDVIDLYEGPLMCSHTCSRTLHDHPRNITDEQLRLLCEKDGIVGVCFFGEFLDGDPGCRTIERVVDHIEHFLAIVGEDRVGIGPDWLDYCTDLLVPLNEHAHNRVDVTNGFPIGLEEPAGLAALERALDMRGLPSRKILYENGLRFLQRALPAR